MIPGITKSELRAIKKPAQYVGGERGAINKDEAQIDVHFCLAFPDTYEVGMSHIGMQILYDVLNKDQKCWAQRAYVPLADMEELLRSRKIPLYSLESKKPLNSFDIVGFSLQYELCSSGILAMLDLGQIPLLQKDRSDTDPLIIGGGPFTYHPEPVSDFFDAFLVGDGEELAPEFVEAYRTCKKENLTRAQTLERLSAIEGVYVPSLFDPTYDHDEKLKALNPVLKQYSSVRRRIIPTLEQSPFPTDPVVPNIRAVHDRLSVEVMRGCVRGCRFCQAGYLLSLIHI